MQLLIVTRTRAELDYARRPTAYCAPVHGRGSSLSVLRPACRCHRETVASNTSRRGGGRAKQFFCGFNPLRQLPAVSAPGSRLSSGLSAILAQAHTDILRNPVAVQQQECTRL